MTTTNSETPDTTRRVEVTVTLDIDAAAWTRMYGTSAEQIDIDVDEFVAASAVRSLRTLGLLAVSE